MAVFGKHGESVAEYVTKGRQLLVEGRVEVSESGRFNVVADTVRLGASPKEAKPTKKPPQPK